MSLVDQMVDKVLFKPWIDVELDHVAESVCKTGWSPLPGGYRYLRRVFHDRVMPVAVDKTAWDWTMCGDMAELYLTAKFAQCEDLTDDYVRACRVRFREVLMEAQIRLPNGDVYLQRGCGLMKSGWLLTLSLNSAAQFFQHTIAWNRWQRFAEAPPDMWAMGDDMLFKIDGQETPEGKRIEALEDLHGYMMELSKTGCVVKHMEQVRDFAGYNFDNEYPVPLYQDKHKFILSYVRQDREQTTLLSYFLLYALVPGFGWLSEVRHRAKFAVGLAFKKWAEGATDLRVLELDDACMDWLEL